MFKSIMVGVLVMAFFGTALYKNKRPRHKFAPSAAERLKKEYDEALKKANAANEARYGEAKGLWDQYGASQEMDTKENFRNRRADIGADLAARGLSNSTLGIGPQMRNSGDQQRALADIGDRVTAQKAGVIERRSDTGPDPALLARLMEGEGAAQTAGGGFGFGPAAGVNPRGNWGGNFRPMGNWGGGRGGPGVGAFGGANAPVWGNPPNPIAGDPNGLNPVFNNMNQGNRIPSSVLQGFTQQYQLPGAAGKQKQAYGPQLPKTAPPRRMPKKFKNPLFSAFGKGGFFPLKK